VYSLSVEATDLFDPDRFRSEGGTAPGFRAWRPGRDFGPQAWDGPYPVTFQYDYAGLLKIVVNANLHPVTPRPPAGLW